MGNQVQFDSTVGGNDSIVRDDNDPTTGLAEGGHETRFVPALAQFVAIALWVKTRALDVAGYATAALGYKTAAGASADAAAASAVTATDAANLASANAAASGVRWNFDSGIEMVDPGTGDLRLDNATLANVTAIAVSASAGDVGNPNVRASVLTWDDSTTTAARGTITIREIGAPQNFAQYTVTGAVVDNTTWLQVPVVYVNSSGGFGNLDNLVVQFARTGDVGNADIAALTHASTGKATPVDADELSLVDSAAGNGLKKLSWENLKATLKTYLDTLYVSLTGIKTINGESLVGGGNLAISAAVGDHFIDVHTGNGYASVNTKYRRFTTVETAVGTGVTYADSATLGGAWTVVETGNYSVEYTDRFGDAAAQYFGISVNAPDGTVSVQSLPVANILAITSMYDGGGSLVHTVTFVGKLNAGDVLHAHSDGKSHESGTVTNIRFRIRKIGVI